MAISEASRADSYDLPNESDFRADVVGGLGADPKWLPSKYLYDSAGLKLLDLMCRQPEYYLPAAEDEIYGYFAPDIGRALGSGSVVLHTGRLSTESVRLLLDSMDTPAGYVAVGPSREALQPALDAVTDVYPALPTVCVIGGVGDLAGLPEAVRQLGENRTVFCPGGIIGDVEQAEARELLVGLAGVAGPEGKILIGVDLEKPVELLMKAYGDKAQIADRFHLNLLQRANRELGADFDLMKFRYEAAYNAEKGRMEMYVVSMASQSVSVGEETFSLANNERIRTQISYKYTTDQFQDLVTAAGLKAVQLWLDSKKYFSAYLLEP